jgi:hypothetical protein
MIGARLRAGNINSVAHEISLVFEKGRWSEEALDQGLNIGFGTFCKSAWV